MLTVPNKDEADKIFNDLSSKLKMKNLGEISQFLGCKIIPNNNCSELSMNSVIQSLATTNGLENCRPLKYPMDTFELTDEHQEENNYYPIRSMISTLQYLVI